MTDLAGGAFRATIETPIDDDACTDASAYRYVEHVPRATSGPEGVLAKSGGVGVILQPDGEAEALLQHFDERHIPPADELWRRRHDSAFRVHPAGRSDAEAAEGAGFDAGLRARLRQ